MKLDATVAALTVLVAACGLSTGPGSAPTSEDQVVLELRSGQETTVSGTVVRVSFIGVDEDSRCPVDVVCVWQGNAAVEIGLAAGSAPTHLHVLNTGLEPDSVEFDGLRLTLLDVAPEPREGVPISADDYVVRLGVEPLPL